VSAAALFGANAFCPDSNQQENGEEDDRQRMPAETPEIHSLPLGAPDTRTARAFGAHWLILVDLRAVVLVLCRLGAVLQLILLFGL
jgi:hypothetical protein